MDAGSDGHRSSRRGHCSCRARCGTMSRRDERRRRLAIRKVLRMGHPVLRQRARPLAPEELGSDRIRALVDDMIDTMHDYGGIGLAAPQIGESIRLAVIEIPGGPPREGAVGPLPLTVRADPTMQVVEATSAGCWGGCLSIPGLRGYVGRPQRGRVEYADLDGKPHAKGLVGFLATVLQHELDHLDGT